MKNAHHKRKFPYITKCTRNTSVPIRNAHRDVAATNRTYEICFAGNSSPCQRSASSSLQRSKDTAVILSLEGHSRRTNCDFGRGDADPPRVCGRAPGPNCARTAALDRARHEPPAGLTGSARCGRERERPHAGRVPMGERTEGERPHISSLLGSAGGRRGKCMARRVAASSTVLV